MSETKKRSGCRGCLIWFLIVSALFLVVIGVGAYLGYRKLVSLRDTYTQINPVQLPATSYTRDELDDVSKRIENFTAASRSANTNAQLSLSAADINAWLWSSGLSNRVYVSFTNSSLVGQVSVPLEDIGVRFLKGRYMNGAAVFDVGWVEGALSVKVKDISVNGFPIPEHYMSGLRNVNYAERYNTAGQNQNPLENISRVAIEDGRLIFETGRTNLAK